MANARIRLGERLFRRLDEEASDHGWLVTPVQGGLGRRYRDPRFAQRRVESERIRAAQAERPAVRQEAR
jgi:hypothetical protein